MSNQHQIDEDDIDDFYANIIHYKIGNNGETELDDFNEPMIGWYWQIMGPIGPISQLTGPYSSRDECEDQCNRHWENNSYEEL